MKEASRENFY